MEIAPIDNTPPEMSTPTGNTHFGDSPALNTPTQAPTTFPTSSPSTPPEIAPIDNNPSEMSNPDDAISPLAPSYDSPSVNNSTQSPSSSTPTAASSGTPTGSASHQAAGWCISLALLPLILF